MGGRRGQLAEWLMAADCKSAALRATEVRILHCPPISPDGEKAERMQSRGSNSGVESQPSKLLVAGSNPVSRSKGHRAHVAQAAERVLGKDEVTSSTLVVGSTSGPPRS